MVGQGLIFSPSSQRLAYVASHDKQQLVVIDGQENKAYTSIVGHSLRFSPDSQRVAYAVHHDEQSFVVVDGQECKSEGYGDLLGQRKHQPE